MISTQAVIFNKKSYFQKKWSQDAQVHEIKKNVMLLYFNELCNLSI